MNVTISDRLGDVGDSVGHVLGDVSDTVGQVLGDAWHAGTHLAHELADAAVDRVPGHRRTRSAWTVRRVVIAVGLAATLGLLVLALRRGRQPATGEPGRQPTSVSRSVRDTNSSSPRDADRVAAPT